MVARDQTGCPGSDENLGNGLLDRMDSEWTGPHFLLIQPDIPSQFGDQGLEMLGFGRVEHRIAGILRLGLRVSLSGRRTVSVLCWDRQSQHCEENK
jgi:hypothetical protein